MGAGTYRGTVKVERYKERHWAVFDGGGLVAVTVYRKGALAVASRIAGPKLTYKRRRICQG